MNKTSDKVIVFGSEYVGSGDETLGFAILMNLLETLAKREDRPKAMIFWNTAVKLLAEGSPAVPRLKALEEKGVTILAGRLCVQDLRLTDKIAVGNIATMDEILDFVLHNEVISL
jgi:intracellular sulfur oxidation DsrE/DsrF family protein